MNKIVNSSFIKEIKALLNSARDRVYQNINEIMTKTYFEIGKKIVEEEQKGQKRAKYGKELLKTLSNELTKEFGKGFSVRNLEQMRKFYLVFRKTKTASAKFELIWSHYVFLSRIENEYERSFYEIEAIRNSWSLRELRRQFETLVELTLPKEAQIFASKYQTVLPNKDELKKLLEDRNSKEK